MSTLLIVAYNLRIKQLFEDIKESLPGDLPGLIKTVNPEMLKAFDEGVRYARAEIHFMTGKKPPEPDIEPDVTKALVELTLNYNEAKKIRDFKLKNRLLKLTLAGVTKPENDSQVKQINQEFDNAIKRMTNRALIFSGQLGQRPVFDTVA